MKNLKTLSLEETQTLNGGCFFIPSCGSGSGSGSGSISISGSWNINVNWTGSGSGSSNCRPNPCRYY